MKSLNFLNKTIILKRIKLEKLSLNYLDDIHEYSQDERFFKFLEYRKFKTKLKTKSYIKQKMKESDGVNAFWWVITLNGKSIGTICIHSINMTRKSCDLGYGINPKYWGKGYFKEAVKGLMRIIIRKDRFRRCQAVTAKFNQPSAWGLIKCGFKQEGALTKFYYGGVQKKNFDALLLAKTI
mgnify:CR=1 FL=1|tara:strand:+ start:55 stop:597 length:543 start_codon:yes stop_codon:yes gene_type:complete